MVGIGPGGEIPTPEPVEAMMWPFKKTEKRSASSTGYTSQIIAAREGYISGSSDLAELTATVQGCVTLWENAFTLADVSGTDMLDRHSMALLARSVALRGEAVLLIRDRLVACSDWDVTTRNGVPKAYRVSVSEAGGARSETALAGEILHLRIGSDPVTPWAGQAPLRRAGLSASLLQEVENVLRDVYRDAPMGSLIAHVPEGTADDAEKMRASFRGRRGSTLVIEGTAQAAAAGMAPNLGKAPDQLTPDLQRAMTAETLEAARGSICWAFGVLPAMLNKSTTGPLIREGQRHLAGWMLQPMAELLAEEASDKLGGAVTIDVMRPLQAYDAGGRARALSAVIGAMAQAKESGVDPAQAMALVDWKEQG